MKKSLLFAAWINLLFSSCSFFKQAQEPKESDERVAVNCRTQIQQTLDRDTIITTALVLLNQKSEIVWEYPDHNISFTNTVDTLTREKMIATLECMGRTYFSFLSCELVQTIIDSLPPSSKSYYTSDIYEPLDEVTNIELVNWELVIERQAKIENDSSETVIYESVVPVLSLSGILRSITSDDKHYYGKQYPLEDGRMAIEIQDESTSNQFEEYIPINKDITELRNAVNFLSFFVDNQQMLAAAFGNDEAYFMPNTRESGEEVTWSVYDWHIIHGVDRLLKPEYGSRNGKANNKQKATNFTMLRESRDFLLGFVKDRLSDVDQIIQNLENCGYYDNSLMESLQLDYFNLEWSKLYLESIQFPTLPLDPEQENCFQITQSNNQATVNTTNAEWCDGTYVASIYSIAWTLVKTINPIKNGEVLSYWLEIGSYTVTIRQSSNGTIAGNGSFTIF